MGSKIDANGEIFLRATHQKKTKKTQPFGYIESFFTKLTDLMNQPLSWFGAKFHPNAKK